jgi:uncharacterized delta-60 repeat protein
MFLFLLGCLILIMTVFTSVVILAIRNHVSRRKPQLRVISTLLALFAVCFVSLPLFFQLPHAHADQVALDPTFGNNGIVTTPFGHNAAPSDAISQTDGKTIVVGFASNGSHNNWAIVRYNPNGSLDPSFGTNGIIIQDFGYDNVANGVGLQSNGEIIVAGADPVGSGGQFWTIGRYTTNGVLDTTFGNNGIATTTVPLNGSGTVLFDLAIQPDDKIVAVGYNGTSSPSNQVILVRYNADGSLDQTFGNGGIVVTGNIGGSIFDIGSAVALEPDGKIAVFGDLSYGGNSSYIFLLRYNSDGSIDTTFGNGGNIIEQIGDENGGRDVVVQPNDGKVVVTGQAVSSGQGSTYAVRYNPNGGRDATFANNGLFENSFASNSRASTLILQPTDGKILLGGADENDTVFALRRLNTDGTLDNGFGTNGSILTSVGSSYTNEGVRAIALPSSGKILAVGMGCSSYCDWALAQYTSIAPTPTPPPTTTVTFDDRTANTPLNSTYAGINWGSGMWDVDGPISTDSTNSISFHTSTVTNGTFAFLTSQVLISTQIYSNSSTTAMITLSCSGDPTVSAQVSPNTSALLVTNWTVPCTTVTVTSSNSWNTNLDNLVYSSTSNPSSTPTPTPNGNTLGHNVAGSLLDTGDSGYMNGTQFTMGATSGTATNMSVFIGNVDSGTHNQYQMAIYTDVNGKPGVLIAKTVSGVLTPLSWNTLSISASLTANTPYWLMYNTNGTTTTNYLNNMYYDPGTSGIAAWTKHAFGSWPTSFPTPTFDTTEFSIYVTFTPVVQPTSTPSPQPTSTPTPSPTSTPTPTATATPTSGGVDIVLTVRNNGSAIQNSASGLQITSTNGVTCTLQGNVIVQPHQAVSQNCLEPLNEPAATWNDSTSNPPLQYTGSSPAT